MAGAGTLKLFSILILLAVFAMALSTAMTPILKQIKVAVVTGSSEYSHGETKHGIDAVLANNCFDKNNAALRYSKPDFPNRKVEICLEEGEFMAIRICDKEEKACWFEKTKYIYRDIKNIIKAIDFAESEMGELTYFDYVAPQYQGLIDPALIVH